MHIPPKYKAPLLAQVCCGIPELCEFLECEIDLLWLSQENCNERLKYYYTLLGLIEAAQIFSRNKIDTATRIASTNSQERFTAFSTRKSESERDASGRTCSWATATSAQYFNRESTDHTVAFSETNGLLTYNRDESGYDLSTRHTAGNGFGMSRVESSTVGRHGQAAAAPGETVGTDNTIGIRETATSGGTSPYVALKHPQIYGISDLSLTPPFFEVTLPGPFLDIEPAITSHQFCPDVGGVDPPIDFECPVDGFPSAGQGYNITFKISIVIPIIGGSLSFDFSQGFNQRQYYHCSHSTTRANYSRAMRDRDLVNGSTDASERENQSLSNERTDIYNVVRKFGIGTKRGTNNTDAEEIQKGRASGLAHSESERDSQGTAYQQSRAEAESVLHAESHLRKNEFATEDYISNKFGQVSTQLAELWKRIWENIKLLERQLVAIPLGGSMNRSGCCPVRMSYHDLMRVRDKSMVELASLGSHAHKL